MRSISSSVRPADGLTVMLCDTPVSCSRAVTERMPSASTWNVTATRASPGGRGGIPDSRNRASDRLSCTSSRSPCTTWMSIPVWPSANVVNSCVALVGMVVLRWISFSASPPIVSSPRLSGATSRRSTSCCGDSAVSKSACTAAPSATTSSGSMSASGSIPNSSRTYARTAGTRVEPPTRMTPSRPFPSGTPASFKARRLAGPVRGTNGGLPGGPSGR